MNNIKRSLSLSLLILVAILAMDFSAQASGPGCTNLVKFSRKEGYFPIDVTHTFASGGSSNLPNAQIVYGYPGQVAYHDMFTIIYAACPGTTTNSTLNGYYGANPIWGYKGFYATNVVVEIRSAAWTSGHNRATYKATSSRCEGYDSPELYFTVVSGTSLCNENNSIAPGDEEFLAAAFSAMEEESKEEAAPESIPIIYNGLVLDWDAYKVWWEVNNGTYQD